MANLSLKQAPGGPSADELIAEVENGIYILGANLVDRHAAVRLYLGYPGRHHYAERGQREGQQQEFPDYGQDQNRIVGNARQARPGTE
jgi:hypothetical protein